jgi:hypothetical protein
VDVGRKVDFFNRAEAIAAGVWALKNMMSIDSNTQYSRVIFFELFVKLFTILNNKFPFI